MCDNGRMKNLNDFVVSAPTLDRWVITRTTLTNSPRPQVEINIVGWCARRKKPLWSHVEIVNPEVEPMKVSDIVHHLALVCEQDRPTTQHELHLGLMGEAWDQPELPW